MQHFREALNWLNHLSSEAKFFREKKIPSLEITKKFLDFLEKPDVFFEYRIIIGGTAGKGSVCTITEQTLLKNKKTVTTLLSPHIEKITERIRINGQNISEENFGSFILKIKEASKILGILPTYYEAIVLAGILAGKKNKTDILVAEIGIGGAYDAVNAVSGKRISGLTFIGRDHTDVLGDDLADIAKTKAGIFTTDSVFSISYEKNFQKIVQKEAKNKVVFLEQNKNSNELLAQKISEFILKKPVNIKKTNLPARWENIKLSKNFIKKLFFSRKYYFFTRQLNKQKNLNFSLRKKYLCGRRQPATLRTLIYKKKFFSDLQFQSLPRVSAANKVNIQIILDGAHSEPRFVYIKSKIKNTKGKKIGIFAMTKNHDPKSFEIIKNYFDEIFWVQLDKERNFWSAEFLCQKIKKGKILDPDPQKTFLMIIKKFFETYFLEENKTNKYCVKNLKKQKINIFILGSFFLCGEIRKLILKK